MPTFPIRALIAPVVLILTSCAGVFDSSVTDWGPPPSVINMPPEDVIAIGKLENVTSEPTQYDPDDLIGHGWFLAKLHVSRVERGNLPGKVVPVRYFGHTWLRESIKIRFRLRPTKHGAYIICKQPEQSGYNCE